MVVDGFIWNNKKIFFGEACALGLIATKKCHLGKYRILFMGKNVWLNQFANKETFSQLRELNK